MMKLFLTFAFLLSFATAQQRPKILCLHGGGSTANGFQNYVSDLEDALPDFELVFAQGPYGSFPEYLWIRDPPGGKDNPTTDPGWADESIDVLDAIRETEGPFYGILGYSQGAAFVPVYLSRVPDDTFQVAITFCGYLTETHLGLLDVVYQRSPFNNIPHLVWMGRFDFIIVNSLTYDMADEFTSPNIIRDMSSGHIVPGNNQNTFDDVVSWIYDQNSDTPVPSPTPSPTNLCYDSSLNVAGTSIGCPEIVANNACGYPGASSHCPLSCNACDIYGCLDSEFSFDTNSGVVLDCDVFAGLPDVDLYCTYEPAYSTCRETCGVCL